MGLRAVPSEAEYLHQHLPSMSRMGEGRSTGVGSRSLRAVLFSETGIWPIKYRRVYLALTNLCYLLKLDHQRPAWNGLQESLILARDSQISWINDLRIVLSRLYVPVELDISPQMDVATVELAMKLVKNSMEAWIDDEIQSSSRVRSWDGSKRIKTPEN